MRLVDLELAVRAEDHPGPAGAKVADSGIGELLFKRFEVAERRLDRLRNAAGGLASALRRHGIPIERMVPRLRCTIEDSAISCFHEFFQRLALLGSAYSDQIAE